MTEEKVRRKTRQRAEIRAILADTDEFTSAQSLFGELKLRGLSIGLATVYRTLSDMVDASEVDVARTDSGEQLYRLCGSEHHHHLICTTCGQAVEIQAPLEDWVRAVSAAHGYSNVHHVVDLYGTCASCQKLTAGGRP